MPADSTQFGRALGHKRCVAVHMSAADGMGLGSCVRPLGHTGSVSTGAPATVPGPPTHADGKQISQQEISRSSLKAVGNFADHLQCNAVHGLVDPKLQVLFCQLPRKS